MPFIADTAGGREVLLSRSGIPKELIIDGDTAVALAARLDRASC